MPTLSNRGAARIKVNVIYSVADIHGSNDEGESEHACFGAPHDEGESRLCLLLSISI